ncbi:unnamed protein product [Diplocarpon coronariae]|uniref:Uncharacterized protein n=1 Tax=Diplocarpon coronariae TaxID=2795749 RepID=A0A218ZAF0_9HELO|nr:hypothetical protein B2J93_4024 [Marssonina coronariae]
MLHINFKAEKAIRISRDKENPNRVMSSPSYSVKHVSDDVTKKRQSEETIRRDKPNRQLTPSRKA